MNAVSLDPGQITGLILAGGQGRRMGGVDKGLQSFRGYPMVMHAVLRLAPQVGPLLINANQNLDAYGALGHPVITDQVPGYAGPLAGLHAGLARCDTPWLLSVPCDSPFLPSDLAERLACAVCDHQADCAVARTGKRTHPVFALVRTDLVDALHDFIREGGRKVESWHDTLRVVHTDFDDHDAFLNINTLDDLQHLAMAGPGGSARRKH